MKCKWILSVHSRYIFNLNNKKKEVAKHKLSQEKDDPSRGLLLADVTKHDCVCLDSAQVHVVPCHNHVIIEHLLGKTRHKPTQKEIQAASPPTFFFFQKSWVPSSSIEIIIIYAVLCHEHPQHKEQRHGHCKAAKDHGWVHTHQLPWQWQIANWHIYTLKVKS
jgi:hypothetical protein